MDFAEFKKRVYQQFGLYLDGYKEAQLKRRIESLMRSLGVSGYDEYWMLLRSQPEQWRRFVDKITINVSEFFRNPEVFKKLEEEVIPGLLRRRRLLKVWSAACADGPEPYSLAMILKDLTPQLRHRIEATDIDEGALEAARRGVYRPAAVRSVSPERLKKYFRREGEFFVLSEEIKSLVAFRRLDLINDAYGSGYDLILCRNVMIYFTAEVQDRLHRKFYQALSPGGVLVVGASESIFRYSEIGFVRLSPWFYGRPEEARQQWTLGKA